MYNDCEDKNRFVIPDSIIDDVEVLANEERMRRKDFAKEAFQFYIDQKKRFFSRDTIISGYREMAQINLTLAELGMTIDDYPSDDNSEGEIAKGE
ncbi:MAG: antitoxin [Clostridioides sp.]|nr:antitoxin [Clostridioides sp.]